MQKAFLTSSFEVWPYNPLKGGSVLKNSTRMTGIQIQLLGIACILFSFLLGFGGVAGGISVVLCYVLSWLGLILAVVGIFVGHSEQ